VKYKFSIFALNIIFVKIHLINNEILQIIMLLFLFYFFKLLIYFIKFFVQQKLKLILTIY